MPLGQYDPETVTWLPSDNGLVVEILNIQDGLAVLDLDGTGLAADDQALADFILWREWDYFLGAWDARGHGFGG